MNKLKAITRSVSFNPSASTSNKNNRHEKDKIEAVVGFKLTLHESSSEAASGPELEVQLIGARHLPSNFGLKTVEGYQIKVKLFPGNAKFDSSIYTTSWPKINETFRFPMKSSLKSSMKSKMHRDYHDMNGNETLTQKLFKGTFVVFTVIALLELPSGTYTGIKGTYQNFKRQGSLIIRDRMNVLSNLASFNGNGAPTSDKNKNQTKKLTTSESQRNIGVVTYFLSPKDFEENVRSKTFSTEEMWLPIRDITVASNAKLSVQSSPKGQAEMILELCDNNALETKTDDEARYDKNLNPFECESETPKSSSKSRFSFSDVKLPGVAKRFMKPKKDKHSNGLCLKITTSKMRCSIKVKEEFENDAAQIYVKTTIFEHEILSDSWKSELFAPTLSTRWDHLDSTICIPLVTEESLENVSIKTTVATKTKLGKKIILGVIYIRPDSDDLDHWMKMITMRNTPIPMWYSFE